MNIQGKVVARTVTGNKALGMARVEIKVPRGAPLFRFFDIDDLGELHIGDRLSISIMRVPKEPAKVIAIDIETTQDWSQCCICRPGNDLAGHFCAKHAIEQGFPVFGLDNHVDGCKFHTAPEPLPAGDAPFRTAPGGCVSIPDPPSVSETLQAELEPLPIAARASWPSDGDMTHLVHSQE